VRGVEVGALVRYLVRHPVKIATVVASAWGLRANGWWRRAPFLPLPDRGYWDFRVTTAMGSHGPAMGARDVVDAATWSRRQRVDR